jgi:hypothetical protein
MSRFSGQGLSRARATALVRRALNALVLEVLGMDADFCNTDGARRLKLKIEDYWRDRGFDVDIKLIDAGFMAAMRSARTDVRSDMVNGFPRKRRDDERAATRRVREFA